MIDINHLPMSFFVNGQVGYKFGKSGFLILNSIFYKYTLEEKFIVNIELILSDIITHIEEDKVDQREYEELADFSRVMFFLENIGVLDVDDYDFIFNKIRDKLQNHFLDLLNKNDFHFCRGILVFGNYYLESPSKYGGCIDELKLIVDFLKNNSFSKEGIGCYWINENPNFKNKIFSSSVYGNLSVCKFLFDSLRRGITSAGELLMEAMHFTMHQLKQQNSGLNIFLEPIDCKDEGYLKPKLQWVDGTFNILFSLVAHFKTLLADNHYDFILQNLRIVATLKENEVDCEGPSIGYGSAGVMLMFEKLHRITGEVTFKNAARYWCDVTTERLIGYSRLFEGGNVDTVRTTGFIPGYTGAYTALKVFEENEASILDKLIYI